MMRLALNALALSALVGVGLAACSANVKPNTATVANGPTASTNTQAVSAASTPVPAPASAPTAATASSTAQETMAPASSTEAGTSPASSATSASTASAAPISMPTRGMLMGTVEREFGAPTEKLPAVPDPGTKLHPPITRWVYPQYVVYFEYNYVVHSVLKAHPFSNPDSGTN